MKHYIAVVHQEGDSAWSLHFPDVDGCFSASDDLESLVANAQEALALHFEAMPAPPVRSMDVLRADPDVQDHLAQGAFLLAVPHIALTGRTAKANITMDAGLLNAIDETARKRGLTRSAFLADLARREIAG